MSTSSALPPPADIDRWIVSHRPLKNRVDPWRPYALMNEPERTRAGVVEDVATIFLTNKECPFRCLMCDLWKNTTDERTPDGAIVAQLTWALEQLPTAKHIKLYNAGNFFDVQAIPPADVPKLAEMLRTFETVIIECHPKLIGPRCIEFRDAIRPATLQVAMGLETVEPQTLQRLNKRMTLADFDRAARFLRDGEIDIRAFLMLRPPFMDEAQGVRWAKRSIEHAFDVGVECCVMIPTRGGNGAMEELAAQGNFSPPTLASLEDVIAHGISLQVGRVLADLWDVERIFDCPACSRARADRLQAMNFTQRISPPIDCGVCQRGTS